MSDAAAVLRRWTNVTRVLAIVYTVLAALFLLAGDVAPLVKGSLVACAALLWAGYLLVTSGSYGQARACLIVAGVLGLPLGAVAIVAALNIKRAADSLGGGAGGAAGEPGSSA
jgi:hypothetical protein